MRPIATIVILAGLAGAAVWAWPFRLPALRELKCSDYRQPAGSERHSAGSNEPNVPEAPATFGAPALETNVYELCSATAMACRSEQFLHRYIAAIRERDLDKFNALAKEGYDSGTCRRLLKAERFRLLASYPAMDLIRIRLVATGEELWIRQEVFGLVD